jgi:hypothetical protein
MKILFSQVKVGQRFFDPYSGDYWIKADDTTATEDLNDNGVDTFDPEEYVDVD